MTDLEMTRLCAEAMGLMRKMNIGEGWQLYPPDRYGPLHDDAQAMALVKKLGMTIDPQEDAEPFTWRVVVAYGGDWDDQINTEGQDLNRAIVECASRVQERRSGDEERSE